MSAGVPLWGRAVLPWRASLGAVVVATAGDELVLAGPAAAVWELLDPAIDEPSLVEAAQRSFGLAPEAVSAALDALLRAGLCRST